MNDRSNPAAGSAEGSREQLYIYGKNQYHFLLRWKVSSCESLSFIHIHATVEGVRRGCRRTPGSENEICQSKSAAFWSRQEGLFLRFSCFAACTPTLLVNTQALLNAITENIYNHLVNCTLEYFGDKQTNQAASQLLFRPESFRPDPRGSIRCTSFPFECIYFVKLNLLRLAPSKSWPSQSSSCTPRGLKSTSLVRHPGAATRSRRV